MTTPVRAKGTLKNDEGVKERLVLCGDHQVHQDDPQEHQKPKLAEGIALLLDLAAEGNFRAGRQVHRRDFLFGRLRDLPQGSSLDVAFDDHVPLAVFPVHFRRAAVLLDPGHGGEPPVCRQSGDPRRPKHPWYPVAAVKANRMG